jgi:O-antigen/teichoic acid export membrane protein
MLPDTQAMAIANEDIAKPRLVSLRSYASTTAVTATSIVATLGVSALLARTWSVDDFMLYITLNRYLSLIYCLTSFSLGFGVVHSYLNGSHQTKPKVLPNALFIVFLFCLIALITGQLLAEPIIQFLDSPTLASRWAIFSAMLWVTAQSLYHVVLSYLRGLGFTQAANWLMFLVKTGLVAGLSLWAFVSDAVAVPYYYGILGILILTVTSVFAWDSRATWRYTLDLGVWRELIEYSSSRCIESLLKHCLIPLLITLLYFLNRQDVAGGTVVLAMLLRGVESLFQPLVLMVLADALATQSNSVSAKTRVQMSWDAVLLFSIPAALLLATFAEHILVLWLGESYRELGPAFRYFAISLPAVLGTVLLRGNLDAHYRISPLAMTGCISNALIFIGIVTLHLLHQLSLDSTALMLGTVYWIQFLVLFALLRKQYGISLLSSTLWQHAKKHICFGGHQ